jgi:hypothetical protein
MVGRPCWGEPGGEPHQRISQRSGCRR